MFQAFPSLFITLTYRRDADLDKFEVRCVEIVKKEQTKKKRKQRPGPHSKRALTRPKTWLKRADTESTPLVTAATKGPLSWVTILGCFLSTGLLISSITFGDGMSFLATLLLSFLSTLTGIANKWNLKLPSRVPHDAPRGDTVIRYPNGSYLIVRCHEEIARELYFAPEEIKYQISNPATYRVISLFGTIILMLGIIALANAKLQLQIAWAIAYVFINAAHWVVAALPQRLHWDLSCYEISEQSVEGGPHAKNFTEALWKAILLTQDTRWVKNGNAAPQTHVWDEWLIEAGEQAKLRGHVIGELKEPIFGKPPPTKGVIWTVPPGWDAKTAWNRINKGDEQGKEHGAVPTIQQA